MKKLVFILGMAFIMPTVYAQDSNEPGAENEIHKEVIIVKSDAKDVQEISEKIRIIISETIEEGSLELNEEIILELKKELEKFQDEIEVETKIEIIGDASEKMEKRIIIKELVELREDQKLRRFICKEELEKVLSETIELELEQDGSTKIIKKKWINGEEVNFSEEDSVRILRFDIDPNIQDERVLIDMENGDVTISKWVNGKEVELTTEELEEIRNLHHRRVFDHLPIPPAPPVIISIDRQNVKGMERLQDIDSNLTVNEIVLNGGDLDIRLSPNPSSGSIDYQFNSVNSNDLEVKILDQQGKIISSFMKSNVTGEFNHRFNLEDQASGMYFVRTVFGNSVDMSKVLIE